MRCSAVVKMCSIKQLQRNGNRKSKARQIFLCFTENLNFMFSFLSDWCFKESVETWEQADFWFGHQKNSDACSWHLFLYICTYIYIYIYVCVYTCIFVYMLGFTFKSSYTVKSWPSSAHPRLPSIPWPTVGCKNRTESDSVIYPLDTSSDNPLTFPLFSLPTSPTEG